MSVKATRRISPRPEFATAFATPLGWCGLHFRGDELSRSTMGHANARDAVNALTQRGGSPPVDGPQSLPSRHAKLVERLQKALDGQRCDFSNVQLDLAGMTEFQRAVLAACRNISWGKTATYGDLAANVGSPRAARAVGRCMACNRFPLIVPCHRVLAAGGRIGGFSAPNGVELKRRLLLLEGIE